ILIIISPSSCHCHSKYTKMTVLMIPVGYTRIFSCLLNQTERKPKMTAIISRTMNKVGYPWYCSNRKSKIGCIVASVALHELHGEHYMIQRQETLPDLFGEEFHHLVVIPIDLGAQGIFYNPEPGGSHGFDEFFYRLLKVILKGTEA